MQEKDSAFNGTHRNARLDDIGTEYEQTIAFFEAVNAGLRAHRKQASPLIAEHCDRHIALNSRTIEALRSALDLAREQLKLEDR